MCAVQAAKWKQAMMGSRQDNLVEASPCSFETIVFLLVCAGGTTQSRGWSLRWTLARRLINCIVPVRELFIDVSLGNTAVGVPTVRHHERPVHFGGGLNGRSVNALMWALRCEVDAVSNRSAFKADVIILAVPSFAHGQYFEAAMSLDST